MGARIVGASPDFERSGPVGLAGGDAELRLDAFQLCAQVGHLLLQHCQPVVLWGCVRLRGGCLGLRFRFLRHRTAEQVRETAGRLSGLAGQLAHERPVLALTQFLEHGFDFGRGGEAAHALDARADLAGGLRPAQEQHAEDGEFLL